MIQIDTIPHNEQRYLTCGDWIFDEQGNLNVKVSDTGNSDYNFLIGIHEMIEAWMCQRDGIKEEDVTHFDLHFEDMRKQFPDLVGEMEPGDHELAPYNKNHKMATMFEKWLCDNMKLDWETYNKVVNEL